MNTEIPGTIQYSTRDPVTLPDQGEVRKNIDAVASYGALGYLEDKYVNRPNAGRGIVQAARRKHRQELYQLLTGLSQQGEIFAGQDFSWIGFIPNAKIEWFNVLLKKLADKKLISYCDISLAKTVGTYMNSDASEKMKKFFDYVSSSTLFNKSASPQDITPNWPTKAGWKPTCELATGNLKMPVQNPGLYNTFTGQWEEYPDYKTMQDRLMENNQWKNLMNNKDSCQSCTCSDVDEAFCEVGDHFISKIAELRNQLEAEMDIYRETNAIDSLDMNPKMKRLINYVRDSLFESHLPYEKFKQIAEAFSTITKLQESKYLLSIIDPFKHRQAKIPSEVPIPTSNFSLRGNINLTTNASGLVAFYFQPFFLAAAGANTSSFAINNNAGLTGSAVSNFFLAQDIGQSMPANFYSRYRLVSCGIKITFTSSLLNSTGFCTTAVDFSDFASGSAAAVGAAVASAEVFGLFNTIENGYFKDTKATRNGEILEVNYIPPDSSFTDFQNLSVAKGGFNIVGYISGAPASSVIARLDIVQNFEAIVANTFTDYLPCQVYTGELADMRVYQPIFSSLRDTASTLEPRAIQKAVDEQFLDGSKPKTLNIPLPKQYGEAIEKMQKKVDELISTTTQKISDKIEDKGTKSSWLQSAMEMLSPIAGIGLGYLANRYNPFKGLFGGKKIK